MRCSAGSCLVKNHRNLNSVCSHTRSPTVTWWVLASPWLLLHTGSLLLHKMWRSCPLLRLCIWCLHPALAVLSSLVLRTKCTSTSNWGSSGISWRVSDKAQRWRRWRTPLTCTWPKVSHPPYMFLSQTATSSHSEKSLSRILVQEVKSGVFYLQRMPRGWPSRRSSMILVMKMHTVERMQTEELKGTRPQTRPTGTVHSPLQNTEVTSCTAWSSLRLQDRLRPSLFRGHCIVYSAPGFCSWHVTGSWSVFSPCLVLSWVLQSVCLCLQKALKRRPRPTYQKASSQMDSGWPSRLQIRFQTSAEEHQMAAAVNKGFTLLSSLLESRWDSHM